MCALTPPLFPNFEWPLKNPISQQHNYIFGNTHSPDSVIQSTESQLQIKSHKCSSFAVNTSEKTMVKKLNHNANERDRRKKINSLYSALRSLLPPLDQKKKLSIPGTVALVLKYIPELQKQVEELKQKKEGILSIISKQGGSSFHWENNQRKSTNNDNSLIAVSANRLSDTEVVIQISTFKLHNDLLSEILIHLENNDGLLLINASSFESFGGRVFHILHLQVGRSYKLELEVLNEKLVHRLRSSIFNR